MTCTLQTDSGQWLALMGADPALRDCIADVFGIVGAEITVEVLAEIQTLINELLAYQVRLQFQLDGINGQLICVDLTISTLTALAFPTLETNALKADMLLRKTSLEAVKIELETTLLPANLPAQIANTLTLQQEMLCQKANAEFFLGLL